MYSGLLHSYNNRRGTIADAEEVGSKPYMDGKLVVLLPDSPGGKGVSPSPLAWCLPDQLQQYMISLLITDCCEVGLTPQEAHGEVRDCSTL